MKGIDVSAYQGTIDFNQVKQSGIEIIYLKATEGATYKDHRFEEYYTKAIRAGLQVGCYHFLRANNTQDEITNLLETIKDKKFDCPIAIDCEIDLGGIYKTSLKIRNFADKLLSLGYKICLYTGTDFYLNNLNNSVKDIPLWVAQYGNAPLLKHIGWQYTDSGKIAGINGNVDLDSFTSEILIGGNTMDFMPIKKGENSRRVLMLQGFLQTVGLYSGKIDSDFGDLTYSALKQYQTVMNIDVDGVAGIQTITTIKNDILKNWFKFNE